MIAILSPRQLFLLLLTCGMISTGAPCVAAQPKAYVTAARTELRIQETNSPTWVAYAQPRENQACVFLDPDKTFQTILGFGGAITDAAAETFSKLPPEKQKEILRAYFSPQDGIAYSLIRTTIHSCDFSSGSYTYVSDGDTTLASFSIAPDLKFRIPLIRLALETAGKPLPVYLSPWSPPAWMKDSKKMLQGGKLLPEFYETWTRYFVRTIEEYEKAGIPIWGLSAQNEPMAVQRWESCIYTAEEERDFIKNHLGPTLKKSGLGEKKIIAWDHNRDLIYQRASVLLSDPEAASYVWGLGFHWYETWTGSPMMFENLSRVKEAFPSINLLFTEGCVEGFDPKRISDWSLGERYGRSLMGDLNAGAVGWTDWNILLDETGGPNHVGNFCFAPIHANTKTGEIQYTNSYYYLGHFSKFVLPGAKRIATSVNRQDLLASAFLNPDGSLVAVVMNTSDKPLDYTFWMKGTATDIKALPRSISTFIF